MLAALRSRALIHHSPSSSFSNLHQWKLGFLRLKRTWSSSTIESSKATELLNLQDIEQILNDVKADGVRVIPVRHHCDFMVIATGRSTWHVRNIAQALIYKAKLEFIYLFICVFLTHFKSSSSIHTPLISLRTPLLNTPQNKLFTPHSFKQHSHPTLHTPHLFPQTYPPRFLPKNDLRTLNPEIQQ